MAAPTLTKVSPVHCEAGDELVLTGTGFLTDATKTRVFRRTPGGAWAAVDTARVEFVSATALHVTIAAADNWAGGLQDVGVAESTESAPQASLPGAVYHFTAGSYSPDDVIKGAVEELYLDGVFLGHTHGDLDLEHDIEMSDIEVDQSLVAVRSIKEGETFQLSVPLAEVTLEHIQQVWGLSAQIEELDTGRRRLTFGGDSTVVEKSLLAIVPAGSGKKWAITFYRCVVVSPGTLTWSKGDQVDLPLQVKILADTSRAVGDQVGRFEEYAA